MQLEREKIITLIKSDNIAGEFLASDLLKSLEDYNYLLNEVSKKEEIINDTVYYFSSVLISINLGLMLLSISNIGLKILAIAGFTIFLCNLCDKENALRRFSATKTMHSLWSFLVSHKVFNKEIAFSRLVDKKDRILVEIGENKSLIAKLYQEFNKEDSNKMLRNTFARMMTCYKQENNQEILKELMKVLEGLKAIMRTKDDDFMADEISKELINDEKMKAMKEKDIFKKKENYKT